MHAVPSESGKAHVWQASPRLQKRRPLGHRFELPIPCGSDYAREIGPACRTRLPRDNTETLQHSWLSIKFRSVIMHLHIYMIDGSSG